MTDLRILPLLPSETTFCVEGKNAHLFYDGNTGQQRDLIEDFKSHPWHKRYIIMKMDCLIAGMSTSAEDTAEYHTLSEELKKVKEKASKDEKIIRAILMKMGCLIESMNTSEEDTAEYPTLSEELEKVNRKTAEHEKIICALADLNLEKIYVYE